ncbi:MAG: C13 family peptidase [Pirellulales bacterium]|nr:C13 family peptidase [Pirellulales bacterium]
MMLSTRACRAVLAFVMLAPAGVRAKDYFLTIGGGNSPPGNQVSLEKNVLFFQRVLVELGLAFERHDVLFSDGDDPGRDLQFDDPAYAPPEANLWLARLFNQEDGLRDQFRSHLVPAVRGPATRASIERWFSEIGPQLNDQDRLFIYFTGHGGKGNEIQHNIIHLWNKEKMTVEELVAQLDKLPQTLPVVMVMVQCYSGGFANTIFQQGNSKHSVSPADRCGFFATVPDRVAAGCTADIDEDNYQEYSSFFWAALAGQSRTGKPLERPDYDGDGRTSLAEAHAYSLLESDTIDISIKTSDALLRAFSKTKDDKNPDLITPDTTYEKLLALAAPCERAVLEGLSAKLALEGNERAKAARELGEQFKKQKGEVEKGKGEKNKEFRAAAGEIVNLLKQRWPELENRWHAKVQEVLSSEPDAVIAAIQSHAKWSDCQRLHDEIARLADEALDLERKWVKTQRFVYVAESVALAANLPSLAAPDAIARYQALTKSEARSILPEPPAKEAAGQ